jgi:hypothetical protein
MASLLFGFHPIPPSTLNPSTLNPFEQEAAMACDESPSPSPNADHLLSELAASATELQEVSQYRDEMACAFERMMELSLTMTMIDPSEDVDSRATDAVAQDVFRSKDSSSSSSILSSPAQKRTDSMGYYSDAEVPCSSDVDMIPPASEFPGKLHELSKLSRTRLKARLASCFPSSNPRPFPKHTLSGNKTTKRGVETEEAPFSPAKLGRTINSDSLDAL